MTTESNINGKFEEVNVGQFESSVFSTLILAYKPYMLRMGLAFSLGFAGRVLLLANANIIGHWVDQRLENSGPTMLKLGLFCTVGFFFTWFFRVSFSRLSALAVSQIYDEVTWRTSRYPMSFFDRTPTGRIVTRFSSDYGNVFRLFGGPLAEFFAIIFDLIAMIFLAIAANPLFLVVVLIIGISNFAVYKFNQKRLRVYRRQLSASRSPSIAHFAESAQGVSLIRIFDKTSVFARRFTSLDQFFLSKKKQTFRGLVYYGLQMNTLTAVILLITGLASLWMINRDLLTVGSIGVVFTFIVLSGNTMQMFFDWLSQLEEAMIGVERLDQYLRLPLEDGAKIPNKSRFEGTHDAFYFQDKSKVVVSPPHFRNAQVEVRNLYFRYFKNQNYVLENVSFTLRPGEKLGIIGRTGSGKSSLIQALFRLYPTEKGSIRINGYSAIITPQDQEDSMAIDLDQYRQLMTYVPQESTLFRGTLRQNLDLSNMATEEHLIESIARVGLRNWFTTLPNQLDFQVEEKGRNLSLGERQLLCLARASLRDAPLVILDEATSSIDPQSEEMLDKALSVIFQGKTQILIAHRLSTLKKCDRVLWIHQGKIMALDKAETVMQMFRESDLTRLDS